MRRGLLGSATEAEWAAGAFPLAWLSRPNAGAKRKPAIREIIMTPKQRTGFYIPKWLAVAKAYDWVMVGGRLLADLEAQWEAAAKFSIIARNLVRDVNTKARGLASAERRAATADDLRHAINLVASKGRHESATKLSNAELNEFARICAVLLNPFEDLATVIPYLHPEEDDRQRAIGYLRKLSYEAQLRAIAGNMFGTKEWDGLALAQLNRLVLVVKGSGRGKFSQRATQPF